MSKPSQTQKEGPRREVWLKEPETKLSTSKEQVNDQQQAVGRKKRTFWVVNRLLKESRKTVQQLELQLCKSEDERSSLVETVRQLESELADSKKQCETISSQKEALIVKREEETGTLRQGLKKMMEMQLKLKEAEKAAKDMKAENDQVVADYEQKLQSVSVALANSENELSQARDRTKKLEKEMADYVEKMAQMDQKTAALEEKEIKVERQQVNLEQRNNELAKKLEDNEELLLEKIAELQKAAADNEELNWKLDETESKLEMERLSALEKCSQWQRDCNEAESALESANKEKLELIEAKEATEEGYKQLIKVLETKEAEMKEIQERNARLEAGSQQNESAIERYNEAVQEVDNVTRKYEELLAKKNQELGQHQTNLQALREAAEKAETKFLAEQRKNQQMQKELEHKTEEVGLNRSNHELGEMILEVYDGLRSLMSDEKVMVVYGDRRRPRTPEDALSIMISGPILKHIREAILSWRQRRWQDVGAVVTAFLDGFERDIVDVVEAIVKKKTRQ